MAGVQRRQGRDAPQFSREGKSLQQFGKPGQSRGSADTTNMGGPANLTPDQRFLYMIDGANHHVWVLDRETLQLVARFGQQGLFPPTTIVR